jgi:ornithine carbamoyltransferase
MIDSALAKCEYTAMTPEKISAMENKVEQLKARIADARKKMEQQERAKKHRAKMMLADLVVTDEFLWARVMEKATDEQRKIIEVLK